MTVPADDPLTQWRRIVVNRLFHRSCTLLAAAGAAFAIVATAAAAPPSSNGRTHYATVSAAATWRVEIDCLATDTQVQAWSSTVTSHGNDTTSAEIGVWIGQYDTCTGMSVSSWQGTISAQPGELALAADLATGSIRAVVPVTDHVSGAETTVAVDVQLRATTLSNDSHITSHYRTNGFHANYSGSGVGYDAEVEGSVRLGADELARGTEWGALYASGFGQTVLERQALFARAFAGATSGGPIGSTTRDVAAYWSHTDEASCLVTDTSVVVRDQTTWDGTRDAVVEAYLHTWDPCGSGEASLLFGVLPLDEAAFTFQSTSTATLRARLPGVRWDGGESVPIDVELTWTGTGVRSVWQLTEHFSTPLGPSTFHHNESWREAEIAGTIAVAGVQIDPGALVSAGLHREANLVTQG